MYNDIIRDCELTELPKTHYLNGAVFTEDNEGQKFGFAVKKNGTAQTLTGSVTANIIRADNATVRVSGSISENVAYILLPESAIAADGPCVMQIRLINGTNKITLGRFAFTVLLNSSDTIVDPGHVIPSIEELLAQIEVMEDAISRANAISNLCDNMTVSATAASGSTPSVTKTTQYNEVTPASGANPHELGYYEYSDGQYVPTEDETVTSGKTYYVGAYNIAFQLARDMVSMQETRYQVGDSGTTEPTGTWQTTIPTVPQGKFLWVKTLVTYDSGATVAIALPSRQGMDGSGSVNSVNSISPDSNGNVSLGELVKSVNDIPPPPGGNGNINLPIDDAPITNSSNPVKSGALKTALDAKADSTELAKTNGALAIVQTGDTATQTIDAGAYVLWQGDLYTADASIPSGDPFATSGAGKNLTAVPNGGLNALNRPVTAMYYRYADGAGSHTFTIENGARLLLTSCDSSANSQGMWFIRTTGVGAVGKKDVAAASDITFDTATANKLKITVTGYTWLKFEDLTGGNVTEKVSV